MLSYSHYCFRPQRRVFSGGSHDKMSGSPLRTSITSQHGELARGHRFPTLHTHIPIRSSTAKRLTISHLWPIKWVLNMALNIPVDGAGWASLYSLLNTVEGAVRPISTVNYSTKNDLPFGEYWPIKVPVKLTIIKHCLYWNTLKWTLSTFLKDLFTSRINIFW